MRVDPRCSLRKIACALLAACGTLSLASAASVQLAWDKNPEKDIAAYEVSYGTASGILPNTFDAGNNTAATVADLEQGVTYYFVVVARNKAGLLGPKSAQIAYTPSGRASEPPNGTITSPDDTVTIDPGDQVSFGGEASDPNDKTPLNYRWDFGSGSGIPDSTARNPGNRRFNQPGSYRVTFTVTNALGTADPTPAVQTVIVRKPISALVSRKRWKVKFVDSQEADGYAANYAIDGNPATFWHTQFRNVEFVKKPHEIQIDMGKASLISGFQYLSRQDGFNVGNIGKFKFYVSMDGKKWGAPVASGKFENSAALKQILFTAKRGRYLRLRSLTEANGYTDSAVAELEVLRAPKTKASAPSNRSASSSLTPVAPAGSSFAISAATGAASDFLPSSPAITTEVIDGQKYLSLTVAKPLLADGVKRTVQVSPDLLDWFSGSKHTTVVIDNASILKVRDNTPLTRHGKRFIRLKETPR